MNQHMLAFLLLFAGLQTPIGHMPYPRYGEYRLQTATYQGDCPDTLFS
jgi:hypothetical protein